MNNRNIEARTLRFLQSPAVGQAQRTAYVSFVSFVAFYSAPRHLMALNFFIYVF